MSRRAAARTLWNWVLPAETVWWQQVRGNKAVAKTVDVILQQNVDKLGGMGDVVRVRPGYARNFLVPQKAAVYATPKNVAGFAARFAVQQVEAQKERERIATEQRAKERKQNRVLRKLQDTVLVFDRELRDDGTLNEVVTKEQIIDKARRMLNIVIPDALLQLPEPISQAGLQKLPLQVFRSDGAQLHLTIEVKLPVAVDAEENFDENAT